MIFENVLDIGQLVILIYFLALNSAYLSFTVIAFFDLVKYRRKLYRGDLRVVLTENAYRPISILVPAHNERETIVSNVRSLLALGYPEFEIIVINDGSTDDTVDVLRQAFGLFLVPAATRVAIKSKPFKAVYRSLDHPSLVVVDKENGGKSDALNAGLNVASYPLYCSIDADSLLESDAVLRVARAFAEDERIVAAGGIVRVLNGSVVSEGRVVEAQSPGRPMLLAQALEYIRGFLTGRTALARLNSLMIISGAFGIFRKDAVIAAGGYRRDTVCEDMELIVRLHRRSRERKEPGKVIFVPDPICWTQIPSDWRSLLRQRDRWQRGLLESLWMHRRMFLNPRYGSAGLIAMPYYTLFEAIGPLVEAFGYLFIVALWLLGRLETEFAVLFFLFAILYDIVLTVGALILDDLLFRRYSRTFDLARMIAGSFMAYLGYRQILAFQRSLSFVTVFIKRRKWEKVKRQAISPAPVRMQEAGGR
ncbi:MAG: glycosyltransferase [Acidobacteriota bacterium]